MKTLKILLPLFVLSFLAIPTIAQEKKKEKPLSLETTRKLEFKVDEGTWMSVDASPDDKTIYFDLLGDIYTLPITGGKAKPLIAGLGFASQPVVSPDGKNLAFVSDRSGSNNLWIAGTDGSNPIQLSKEKQAQFASPTWSANGELVFVSKSATSTRGAYEIWAFHIDGGRGVRVSTAPRSATAPRSSYLGAEPVNGGMYFARIAPSQGPRFRLRRTQIVRRDVAKGEEDQVTFIPGMAFRPKVSGDGKYLVFGTRYEAKTGLRIRDLTNGSERWLKFPIQRDELESRPTRGLLPGYKFLSDNRSLLIAYEGKIRKIDVETGRESMIPFSADVSLDAGPELYVDHKMDEGPVRARLIQEPEVSKTGKLAFSALAAIYRYSNGKPVRLTNETKPREYQPAWSPDDKSVVFVTWSTKGGHVKTVDVASKTVRTLTKVPSFYKDPVFSPDGRFVIALRTSRQTRVNHPSDFLGPQPGLDIVKIDVDSGSERVVVPSRGLGKPHFGPEKDRFYVYGNRGLVSYRLDGSDQKVEVRVVGPGRGTRPNPARDVRISPDGKHVLATFRNNRLYIAKVVRAGNGPLTLNINSPALPLKRLSTIGADSFSWADDGETAVWTVGSTVFKRKISEIEWRPKKPEKKDPKTADKESEAKPADAKAKEPVKKLTEEDKAESTEIVVEVPRYKPKGMALLRGARVITMKGREVIENADILVVDNRIKEIGARGSFVVPTSAKVFDLSGKTIMPGIVDIHAHWEVRHSVLDTEDYTFLGNLAYGVTTGRDPQTNTNDTFAYQDLVDAGMMLGPRIYNTGPGVFGDSNFKSYKEAYDTIARYKKHYRAETLKSYLVGNRQQRQWVVRASKELGIIPTTEGGANFAMNLTHAIDGFSGNEHSLPIVPIKDDVVQLYARSGIAYTPTLVVSYGGPSGKYYFFEKTDVYGDKKLRRFNPQAVLDEKTARLPFYRDDEYIFPQIAEGAAEIVRAGGRVGIGGHGELQGLQCHWEMWAFAMGGMSNHDVLRTATIMGAESIGFGKEFGSLEKGKLADLIVLDKNPLDDIKNTAAIRFVMKNGEMYEGDTLDQVHPVQKPLPQMWWWSDLPENK